MRVIITGSREYTDYDNIKAHIEQLSHWYCVDGDNPLVIIHGAARGADTLAEIACKELGVKFERFPVTKLEWKHFPHTAGRYRNERMLASGVDMVVAFKDNPDLTLETGGTEHMVRIALEADVLAFFALSQV